MAKSKPRNLNMLDSPEPEKRQTEKTRMRTPDLPAETRAYAANVAAHLQHDGNTIAASGAVAFPVVWTHAPLFVVQPVRSSTADAAASKPSSGDASTISRARDVSAIALRLDGLFVAPTRSGRAP